MPLKCPIARAEYAKAYRDANKEKATARTKKWRIDNPEKHKEHQITYAKNHPDLIAANQKRWKANHIDEVRAKDRVEAKAYRDANKELIKIRKKTYAQNNTDIINANVAKRKAAKLQRIPKWTTETDLWVIKEIYALSALRTKLTGVLWHVDHIIPLQGEFVSGLHTPFNMQVISATENIKKNNRYEL
jgi:hypothetical protein